jgi:hypothetical protein
VVVVVVGGGGSYVYKGHGRHIRACTQASTAI